MSQYPQALFEIWELPIERTLVSEVLAAAMSSGADFADIFIEDKSTSRLTFLDGQIKDAVSGRSQGAGIRTIHGRQVNYGYTSVLSREGLLRTARLIAAARQQGSVRQLTALASITSPPYHFCQIYPRAVGMEQRLALLERADRAARKAHPAITQVEVTISESLQRVVIANTAGLFVADERPYSRLSVLAIASNGNEQQTGSQSPGRMAGFEFFEQLAVAEIACQAAESATLMLRATYAPAGRMPVVIDKGFGGVIFHEACGHSLETTSVAPRASIFAQKLGEMIAQPCLTAIDDGTIPNEWGSLALDDEGMPTQRTILIENGRLVNYLADYLGSIKTGYPRTGSGRRESYRYPPASRMRNTFIAPGDATLEELIASVAHGIYAKRMGGGSVSPGTGDFNFSVREAYLIRNGKIAEPVRGATLIGNGADILKKISRIGRDLELSAGMCGSISGNIPVNVGQPAILVDEMTVGGSNL
ncbi:MAG: TldD/PmbA family protein [Cyanobacteria bacterium NC_groundwater_1444_Ag_S-0.65um_54_12]|nr:TldD/PmbA family protein [Cyanobacteria bacterium NC_groundwater_1444_Ag_S-0.65um_54_12]